MIKEQGVYRVEVPSSLLHFLMHRTAINIYGVTEILVTSLHCEWGGEPRSCHPYIRYIWWDHRVEISFVPSLQ